MATNTTPEKAGKSSAPATHPKKAPSGEAPASEMGAEDESAGEARRSKDKTGPAKKTAR